MKTFRQPERRMMKKNIIGLILCAYFSTLPAWSATEKTTPATTQKSASTTQKSTTPPKTTPPSKQPTNPQNTPAKPAAVLDSVRKKIQTKDIAASAYLVMDMQSRQILASKNADKKIEPAALTQLMTAYLVFQALNEGKIKPEQELTVSEHAWQSEGSRMFLMKEKPVAVRELVLGLIVSSGNDAAITLAEAISGSEEAFVEQMNAQAAKLGMVDTHFANATGVSADNHLSTANDLVTLAGALSRDFPDYYKIFAEKSFSYHGITQPNRNLLLYRDNYVDGLKAGYSQNAGYHLIASSHRNGRRVISVLLGAASTEARATESSKLLNYALQQFDTFKLYDANQAVMSVRVYKGNKGKVQLGFLNDAYATLPYGVNDFSTELETEQPLLPPIKKGQVLGTLKLKKGDKVLTQIPVVALYDISNAGFFGKIWGSLGLWWHELFD